jgi:polysaccharide export outer membrane protein
MNRQINLFLAVGLLALLFGCATPGPQFDARTPDSGAATLTNLTTLARPLEAQWLLPPTNLFTLGPGDRLDIEVLGDATTRSATIVGPDGKIYFYLLPGLNVWGATLTETKATLERELKLYFREPPQVALTLRSVESKRVWLLGRLNNPGVYALTNSVTLLESISLAGGPSVPSPLAALAAGAGGEGAGSSLDEAADLRRSFVMRQGRMLPVNFQRLLHEGDMSQNIYLQADDFVYLPTALSRDVYVLGAVRQPRAVGYSDSMTLISAISRAGGALTNGYLTHVAIVRGSLSEPKVAVVDYRAIIKGAATDVRLEANDIVYVPNSPYQTLTRYLDLILSTFVRTIGVNEGARAVSSGAAPVGVNVPLGL